MAVAGCAESRRQEARQLNALIDRVLRSGTVSAHDVVAQLGDAKDPAVLAERIRRRGTLVGRSERKRIARVLHQRDALILGVYARAAPAGWSTGWCDGSTSSHGTRQRSAIGGLLFNGSGELVAAVQQSVAGSDTFQTEIVAVERLLKTALNRGVRRIRVHTDCSALARLWRTRRQDARLAGLRSLAHQLHGLQVVAIPRVHNQPAHRLARDAAAPRGTTS